MRFRFIEYQNDIYVVVGITYDSKYLDDICFVSVPLDRNNKSLIGSMLSLHTFNIPLAKAKEITDRNRLISLMVLYG